MLHFLTFHEYYRGLKRLVGRVQFILHLITVLRKMLRILRLNMVSTNSAIELLNRNFLIRNTDGNLLEKSKASSYIMFHSFLSLSNRVKSVYELGLSACLSDVCYFSKSRKYTAVAMKILYVIAVLSIESIEITMCEFILRLWVHTKEYRYIMIYREKLLPTYFNYVTIPQT